MFYVILVEQRYSGGVSMSSVGSSDSSNSARGQDEVVRRNRESASSNESEMVKKHAREIRRLNEEHYAELEDIKNAHSAQMENLRKASNADITARDNKYQTEMENLRGLYRKQMQGQADETQRREDMLRKTGKDGMEHEKEVTDTKIDRLRTDYENSLRAKENSFGETLNENREIQKAAIDDTRERLGRKFEEQANNLTADRNSQVGSLQKNLSDYRRNAETRMREQDLRQMQDKQRASNALLRTVKKERLASQDAQDYLREGFKDGLEATREKFEKAAAAEREVGNMSRESLKSTVGNRIENQVNRLEQENLDLKDSNVRQDTMSKQQQRREIANVTDAYQKNMDNYREQRDEAVRSSNERTHKDVTKVRGELEKQATEVNRYYRTQQDEQNRIHRSAYDNLKGDSEIRTEQIKSNADNRVKNLYETTAEEKARIVELQADNHTASQRAHQDEMKALRSTLEADKQIAVNNLQDHIQKQEVAHSERMNQVVSKYEKQIQVLKDQLVREKKIGEENLKRSTEEMARMHKVALDQVAAQNRDRVRQLETVHSEELRTLNKRNDEKVDQIIAEVKKT